MKKFTEDELSVINYTLKSLLKVVKEELEKTPDGGEVTNEIRTMKVIENLLEKINN